MNFLASGGIIASYVAFSTIDFTRELIDMKKYARSAVFVAMVGLFIIPIW